MSLVTLKKLTKLIGGIFLTLNTIYVALFMMFPDNVTVAKVVRLEISTFILINCFVFGMWLLHNELDDMKG